MKKILYTAFVMLLAVTAGLFLFSSCTREATPVADTDTETTPQSETETEAHTTTETESETETETGMDTDTETESETEQEVLSGDPENMNPLTGLETKYDYRPYRPVAIMINNIKISCPQMGVSKADVMYECLVEGGYTRLMMLVSDYGSLPVVGSVRSSRDYYLDFAQNHDAIYFHAGGSPQAYAEIKSRNINNVDGVNMYTPNTFYRDKTRIQTMGYEHSVMTTGEGIVSALQYLKYRTKISDSFSSPFHFLSEGESITYTGDAAHIHIPYSAAQIADFVYDETSETYLRYQFNGIKHIDGATNEQLAFKNIIMIFNPTQLVAGDSSGRLAVTTTGTGDGYYICNGKYIPIKWSKATRSTPITFTHTDGTQLMINRGKTFVSVVSTSVKNAVDFNYSW